MSSSLWAEAIQTAFSARRKTAFSAVTRPPAPLECSRSPDSPRENVTGPLFETTMVRPPSLCAKVSPLVRGCYTQSSLAKTGSARADPALLYGILTRGELRSTACMPSLGLRNGPEEPVYPAHRLTGALLLEVSIYLERRPYIGVAPIGTLRPFFCPYSPKLARIPQRSGSYPSIRDPQCECRRTVVAL